MAVQRGLFEAARRLIDLGGDINAVAKVYQQSEIWKYREISAQVLGLALFYDVSALVIPGTWDSSCSKWVAIALPSNVRVIGRYRFCVRRC